MAWLTLLLLTLLAPTAGAAEYQGRTLDGQPLKARVYSYETGGVFDATVKFEGRRATIRFVNGSQIPAVVDKTIRNPNRIRATSGWRIFGVGLGAGYGSLSLAPTRPLQGIWLIDLEELEALPPKAN